MDLPKMKAMYQSAAIWLKHQFWVFKSDTWTQLQFCPDSRKLNSISCFDPYPLPFIDELLERLGKARYITTLDLCKYYWQVHLEYTAFPIPGIGLFHCSVLPFGLHGAPLTF